MPDSYLPDPARVLHTEGEGDTLENLSQQGYINRETQHNRHTLIEKFNTVDTHW